MDKATHSDMVKKSISSAVEALFQYVNSASETSTDWSESQYTVCITDDHLGHWGQTPECGSPSLPLLYWTERQTSLVGPPG